MSTHIYICRPGLSVYITEAILFAVLRGNPRLDHGNPRMRGVAVRSSLAATIRSATMLQGLPKTINAGMTVGIVASHL
jgi:hypothetical protein